MIGYVVIRVVLWLVGVATSLFPTYHTVGFKALVWPPLSSAAIINSSGQTRDLLFVIIVVSVLEISLVVDFIYVHKRELGDNLLALAIILLILNIVVLGSSLAGFVYFPADRALPQDALVTVLEVLGGAAFIGLLTELVISCANHHFRGPSNGTAPSERG
jgi:hypothetical protein